MGLIMNYILRTTGPDDTERVASVLGTIIESPEIIELRSDLGGGKTTFTKGLVKGLGINDKVASPTFTLNKVYKKNKIEVHHFDFYRLHNAGVVSEQLHESLSNPGVITVVEWADIVKNVLPDNRISIEFSPTPDNEDERVVIFNFPENKMEIIEKLRNKLSEIEP
jgi:tRNA threonylcarbamoyladenosine biosynthesis protein TsaE